MTVRVTFRMSFQFFNSFLPVLEGLSDPYSSTTLNMTRRPKVLANLAKGTFTILVIIQPTVILLPALGLLSFGGFSKVAFNSFATCFL